MSTRQNSNPAWCWVISPAFIEYRSRQSWTLRSLYCSCKKLTDFFHVRNIVFFHAGEYSPSLLTGLADYEKVVCNIADPLTLKATERQIAQASLLSKLSTDFPNIVGGLVDDFSTYVKMGKMPVDLMKETFAALKSNNASLQLLAVVYAGHFELDFSAYLPYIDLINLWVWKASDLTNLDKYLQKAEILFPKKTIHLGLYLHDYGETGDTLPLDLIQFQFKRAMQYLKDGRITGFHLLGTYLKEEMRLKQARWIATNIAQMTSSE